MQLALANETNMGSLKDAVRKYMQKSHYRNLFYQIGKKSVNNKMCGLFLVLRRSDLVEYKTCIPKVPPYIVVCKDNPISKNQIVTTVNSLTTAATKSRNKQLNLLLIIIGICLGGIVLVALVCYCKWDSVKVSIKFYYRQQSIITSLYVKF